MITLFYKYALAIEETTLLVTISWYSAQSDAALIKTDVQRHDLTDAVVTPDVIEQAFRTRAAEIGRGLRTYQAIAARFGANQGQWGSLAV